MNLPATYMPLQSESVSAVLAMQDDDRSRAIAQDWATLFQLAQDGQRIVIIDTETTGLTGQDSVIELALINLKDGPWEGLDKFQQYYHALGPINPYAEKVHKLSDSYLKKVGVPWTKDRVTVLEEILEGAIVLEWSTGFDKRMMEQTAMQIGITPSFQNTHWYNIMRDFDLFRGLLNAGGTNYKMTKLTTACEFMGLHPDKSKAHGAMYDCMMVLAIMREVVKLTQKGGILA